MHEEVNPNSLLALHAISLAGGLELERENLFLSSSKCQKSQPSSLPFILSCLFPESLLIFLLLPFLFFFWMDTLLGYQLYLNWQKGEPKLLTAGEVCLLFPQPFFFSSNLYSLLVWWGGGKYPFSGAAKCRPHIVSTLVMAAQAGSAGLTMKDLDMLRETCPLLKASCNPSPCLLTQRTSTPSHKPD